MSLKHSNIEPYLNEASLNFIQQWDFFEVCESSNKLLCDRAMSQSIAGHVVVADHQSQGQGTHGRQWLSKKGASLLFSIGFASVHGLAFDQGLSLAVGVSCLDALRTLGLQSPWLKWPNDIYIEDAKLAGILVQSVKAPGDQLQYVIGIGLNVQLDPLLKNNIDRKVADLSEYPMFNRAQILGALINQLFETLPSVLDNGWASILPRWQEQDVLINKDIAIENYHGEVERVKYKGVNDQGEVLLQDAQGQISARSIDRIKLLDDHFKP